MPKSLLSIICLLLPLYACQKSNSEKTQRNPQNAEVQSKLQNHKKGQLLVRLPSDPAYILPPLSVDIYGNEIGSYIFDSLLSIDLKTGKMLGRLAKSWKVSQNGLIYEFFIRPGVYFHDGKELTGADVKFSFDLMKKPPNELAHIQNYYKNLASTELVSKYHVRFKMKKIYFRNLAVLGFHEILPEHIYDKGSLENNPKTRAPIGSGPYQFVRWETGQYVELKRFPKYWGNQDNYWKKRFNFNTIKYRFISDYAVTSMALKKGDIDMSLLPPRPYLEFSQPPYQKRFYQISYENPLQSQFMYIAWNLRLPLFSSKRVRQALAYAMPRKLLNQKLYFGMRKLAKGYFPNSSAEIPADVKTFSFSLKKAAALLKQAGWRDSNGDGILDKNGKKFLFDLMIPNGSAEADQILLIYQHELKKIGIQMKPKLLEWTTFIHRVNAHHFEACGMSWKSAIYPDPYQLFHSSQVIVGGSNVSGFSNQRADALMDKARETLDSKKRTKLYQEFSRILADETPLLFLFESPQSMVISKRIEGVLPLGKLGTNLSYWYIP